jgi:hypothetical protein
MRFVVSVALLLLSSVSAYAQTSPGWVGGEIPTFGQWNALFAAKQNYPIPAGGIALNQIATIAPGTVLCNNGASTVSPSACPNPTITVATNTALAAIATSSYSSVIRLGFAAAGDAPPLVFVSQSGTCSSNSMVNDGGSCVDAAGGNSWKASSTSNGFNVRQFGATGDGATDDAAAIKAAVAVAIALGGGEIYLPSSSACYKIGSSIVMDLSAVSTRFQSRLRFLGDGVSRSCIDATGLAGAAISYIGGGATNSESYISFEQFRLAGISGGVPITVGSYGFQFSNGAAWSVFRGVVVEGFDYAFDSTDADQIGFYDFIARYNYHGMRFNAASSFTDPNNLAFFNVTLANNIIYGLQITHCNTFNFNGGSIQYNGSVGGGAGEFGAKLIDCGTGYATATFTGMIFEGNGGAGDLITSQSTVPLVLSVISSSFMRTNYTTVGYGTNQMVVSGPTTTAMLRGNTFRGLGSYSCNAARPSISVDSGASLKMDDTNQFFDCTVEAPSKSLFSSADGACYNAHPAGLIPRLLINGSATGITYASTTSCGFIKQGRKVTLDMIFSLSSKGTNTGAISVDQLPFTNGDYIGVCLVPYYQFMTGIPSEIMAFISGGATSFQPHVAGATTTSSLTDAALTDSAIIAFHCDYST